MRKYFLILLLAGFVSFSAAQDLIYNQVDGTGYVTGTSTIAIGDSTVDITIKKEFTQPHQGYFYLAIKATGDTILTPQFKNWWNTSIGSDPTWVSLTALADNPSATTATYDIGKLSTYFRSNDGLTIRFSIPTNRAIVQTIVWRVKVQ